MNSNFQILNEYQKLIEYVHLYLFCSFPKSELGLKVHFEKFLYDLLENIMRANCNIGNIRSKYQKEALVNISMLDFFTGLMFERKLIVKRRFLTITNKLLKLKAMIIGWSNEKAKKSLQSNDKI